MARDRLRLFSKLLALYIPQSGKLLVRRVAATCHRWTYKSTPDAKNVVVLGGSFAGIALVKRLSETLPTGYKVILVEKRSHFNYSFNFPRFSVLEGNEHKAFIPYDGIAKGAPHGIYNHIQDTVVGIDNKELLLASGNKIDYRYLAIATGASQPLPVQVSAIERDEACMELRNVQKTIKQSRDIAIVGAGAVGIELATDIKDFYPDKNVTLIHPHGQLLNRFGRRLHDYVMPVLNSLKIRCLLHERPSLPQGGLLIREKALAFSDGHKEKFDLIIACTGSKPNSAVLVSFLPSAVSKETSRILVEPTLQIANTDEPNQRIFAFGDVAEHGGPMMGRAGVLQSEIVVANILAMIKNRIPRKIYVPKPDFEGAIKLTLGKTHNVLYTMNNDGSELLVAGHKGHLDLGISRAWKQYGADFELARAVSSS